MLFEDQSQSPYWIKKRFLGLKLWPVGARQIDTLINRQTEKVKTEDHFKFFSIFLNYISVGGPIIIKNIVP